MAYKTDGTANFNFFINRQGPRGPQGIEGEQGFSPSITEGENTAETYTLQVNNKDGSFTTPNLKPQFQDRGGDVVKVDREHDTLYFGTVDIPEAVDLTTDQTIGGNKKFIGNSTFTGTSHFTDDVSITGANLEVRGVLDATSATITNLQVPNSLTSSGVINAVAMNAASIKNNQNNKYYLTQSSITAGDNVTIEETTEGVKINSTDTKYTLPVASSTTLGGIKVGDNLSITADGTLSATGGSSEPPANMVTTDTEQTITGVKTFSQDVNIQGFAKGVILLGNGRGAGRILADKDYGGIEIYGREYSSDTWKRLAQFLGTGVLSVATAVSIDGNIAYHKGNLIAGDGIKLTTANGITKIAFTGGGPTTLPIATTTTLGGVIIGDGLNVSENGTLSAQVTNTQYGQLLESIADLSTKIDNLTTRLNSLEEVIDGGVASSIYAPEPRKLQEQVVEGLSINEKINNVSEDVQVNDNGGI